MLVLKVWFIVRTVFRFLWVVVGISCTLMTYFFTLSLLKLLSIICCLCTTRNCCRSLYVRTEAKLYKWLLSFMSCWFCATGYEVYESGADIGTLTGDRAFFISNHLDSADVPVLMHKFVNTPEVTENMMWIMDKSYRLTFLGWVAACHGDFFVKTGKAHRDSELERLKGHVKDKFHRHGRRWVVLFPEGGFLEQRRKMNEKFTIDRGLPPLKHITLPRFGALIACYNAFRECREDKSMPKWLIDCTMAYPPTQRFPTLGDVFLGRPLPIMAVNILYRVYRVSDIPFSDEAELTKWMYNLYYEKEAILDHFYKFGSFPENASHQSIFGIPQLPDKSVLQYSWKYYAKLHVAFISCYVFLSLTFAMLIRGLTILAMKYFRSPLPQTQ